MTLLELMSNCIKFITQDDQELNALNLELFKNSSNYKSFISNSLPEINRAIQQIVTYKKLPIETIEIDNSGANSNKTLEIELTKEQLRKIYSIFKVVVFDINGNIYSPVTYKRIGNNLLTTNIKGTIYIRYYPRIRLLGVDTDTGKSDLGISEYCSEAIEMTFDEFINLIKSKSLEPEKIYKIKDLTIKQYKVATSTSGYRDATTEDGVLDIDNSLNLEEIGLDDTICTLVIPYLVKANMWQEIEPELAQLQRNIGLQNLAILDTNQDETYQDSVAVTNRWW